MNKIVKTSSTPSLEITRKRKNNCYGPKITKKEKKEMAEKRVSEEAVAEVPILQEKEQSSFSHYMGTLFWLCL